MKRQVSLMGLLVLVLILLAACARSGDANTANTTSSQGSPTVQGAQEVQITETEYHITTSLTNFAPGKSYHFVVTNKGTTAHEFMIMPKSEGSMDGMPMGNMDTMSLAKLENIAPGQTQTVDYTFSSSAANSHPEFACYLSGHYEAGMKLSVTVGA